MLLLLFGGGSDLSGPITTPPELGTGVVTQFPATSGEWRVSLEIAEPPGSTWYDLTAFYVGDRYQRGADEYKGRYRASIATVQLQVDQAVRDEFGVGPDILAPWGQDTSDLFGTNVRLGAGLLMRLSMVREVDDVVVEWLPIWTGRVEIWGDGSGARGQVRTHLVNVVDTISDLANVPVLMPDNSDTWPVYFERVLEGAEWPFGVDMYGDTDAGGIVADELATVAINRMDAGAEPLGLVWRSLRSGKLVIHPAPWDTTHTERYDNPLLDTYPDGLRFSFSPDFTDIEYIADDDQQPFSITRGVAGIINSIVINYLDDLFDPAVYANDDPTSRSRYGVRPYTASWVRFNSLVADDILNDRAYAESQALPLRTTIDHEGFWPALAMIDQFDPVTILHADSEEGLVANGTGVVRNIVEERTVRGSGLLNWQSTVQIDLDSTETLEMLLPVENLAFVSSDSPGSAGPSSAEFSWDNPTQPSITPTEVQYRILGKSLIWTSTSYPGVGADGQVVNWLDAGRYYTFQVRLIRRVDGVVTNFSPIREVDFFTPNRIWPIPVPDGDDTDGEFTPPDEDCEDFEVELQENDGTGWTTVDTFTGAELTLHTEPWVDANGTTHPAGTYSLTTEIPNSFFNAGSMYRFRSSCDGVTWTTGPAFDPPDDWTDPCPTPSALSVAPYGDAILYVPKICTGLEDGEPNVFNGMQIIEAISGIVGVPGDALAEIRTGIADPTSYALVAVPDPLWSDTAGGIVAYGEAPTTIGVIRDKTLACRVEVADDVTCVLFETAAMRITCTGVSGQWRPGVTIYKTGSTISLAGGSLLDLDTTYHVAATHDYETGDIKLYVDGALSNSVGGTDNVETINALPIWRVGAPPDSWITDCAVWDRVLSADELPGFVNLPTVTIEQGATQDDPTDTSPIVFDVVFSQAVTGFATGDVTLSGSAGATTGTVVDSGDHIHFTVNVTGMTGPGSVTATIAAGVCTGTVGGLPNAASTSTDNTVTFVSSLTVIGWDAAAGGTGSAMDFSAPFSGSARATGDILVVHWTGTNFSNTVPSAPSGWTTVASHRTGSNNPTAVYAKVSDGTETTETWGSSGTGYRWMALIIRGGSSWANGAAQGDSSSGTTKTPSTVSGTGVFDMRLQLLTANESVSLSKTGAAWTDAVAPQVGNFHGGTTMGVGACYSIGSGTSPSFSWSSGGALFYGCGQIVIKP